jgi:hypothetical protein
MTVPLVLAGWMAIGLLVALTLGFLTKDDQ